MVTETDERAFQGGRWVTMIPTFGGQMFQLINVHRPAPRLEEAIVLAEDFLAAPHLRARRDAFQIECTDAAQRLIAVVREPDGERIEAFVADYLAMLVIEIARSRAGAVLGDQP